MDEAIALDSLSRTTDEPPLTTAVRRPSYTYQSDDYIRPFRSLTPLEPRSSQKVNEEQGDTQYRDVTSDDNNQHTSENGNTHQKEIDTPPANQSGGQAATAPSPLHITSMPQPGDPQDLNSLVNTPANTPLHLSLSRTSFQFTQPAEYPPHTPATTAGFATPGTDTEQPFFISALPPVDGGREAWAFLIAATINEALIWGLPFSIGVLHLEFMKRFDGRGESSITLAAALLNGLLYMIAAVIGPFNTAYPRLTRVSQILGLGTASIALIASAFVTEPWHLIVTLGCLYPLAGACYYPCATLLFEWFYTKRGLATGIMYGGTGAGGAIFPFVVSGLLRTFGYRATMVALGVGLAVFGGITLIFIKRRIPITKNDHTGQRRRSNLDWTFLRNPLTLAGVAVTFSVSMGNFLPSLWLPTFAKEFNITKPDGITLIAIMNGCAVPGNLVMGYLTDRLPFFTVILISCVGSASSCLLLWGFGTTEVVLIFFVLTFGLLGLTFCALWAKMISLVSGDDMSLPPLVFSAFTFTRGIGSITSGPISDALLKINVLNGSVGAYGLHNYGVLLLYTGATILAGGAVGVMFKT